MHFPEQTSPQANGTAQRTGHNAGDFARPSVLQRLKSDTAAAHARVDDAIDLSRITERSYLQLLIAMWSAHVAVETALRPFDESLAAFDYDRSARAKRPFLERDIRIVAHDLGVDGNALRADVPSLSLTTEAEAFGAVYVIEGSMLGGQIIARAVAERLVIGPANGGSYFSGSGAGTGEQWRRVCGSLIAFEAASGAAAGMVTGAARTFEIFEAVLRPA